jgi:hypothetical protein
MDRAIPWTALQLSHGQILDDLNVTRLQRAAAFFVCLAALLLLIALKQPAFLLGTAFCLALVTYWNRQLYGFYWRRGGPWFALGAIGMHWFYYLYSVAGFVFAYLRFKLARQNSLPASSSRNP